MKPTPRNSSPGPHLRDDNRAHGNHGSFPSTDYNFQSTVEARGVPSAISETKPRAFWRLSSEFFATETNRDHLTELLLFTLIAGISAWPIVSMIVAVTRLVRNY